MVGASSVILPCNPYRMKYVLEVIQIFMPNSLRIKFQLLLKMLKIYTFLAFKLSSVVFIMLINIKMPIVGILIFMSVIKNDVHLS